VVDAAFAQRRKTLRAALAGWAGSADNAATILNAAGVDPGVRGEMLSVEHFAAIASAAVQQRPGGKVTAFGTEKISTADEVVDR
jgi:16S rRNA (adenine1518-N6/adenine1519-N6)-dimethyltransferase